MTIFKIHDQDTLPGGITLDVQWKFTFDDDSTLSKIEVTYSDINNNKLTNKVPVEAVPADIRTDAINEMREMQGQLQMPGEEL